MPRGLTAKNDIRPAHREKISSPPTRLDLDKSWHLLGMLYWIVGLDRSAFSLFAAALNKNVEVTTYQTVDQLFQVEGMDNDPVWTRMIQGIEPGLNQQFVDHLESYEFRRPKGMCSVKAVKIDLADPFTADEQVEATVWLPRRPGRESLVQTSHHGRLLTSRPLVKFINAP